METEGGKSLARRRRDCEGCRWDWIWRAVVRPVMPALYGFLLVFDGIGVSGEGKKLPDYDYCFCWWWHFGAFN